MADELIAGKFKDDAALEQGIREGMKATTGVELPATVKVIGEGGLYADQAAAVTGYKGIESSLGKLKAPAKPADTGVITLTPAASDTDYDTPEAAAAAAGYTIQQLEAEWQANGGKLKDDTYAALKDKGKLNKASVNAWGSGLAATQQARGLAYEAALTSVGGRDKVKALVAEAEKHIPASEANAYASMLASPSQLPIAVRAMEAIVASKRGNDFVTGGGAAGTPGINRDDLLHTIRRAASGDAAARAAVSRIDTNSILGRRA